MKNKGYLILFFFVPALFLVGFFHAYGEKAWKFWNIPTLQPSFVDARIITASAESYELGFRPEIENPQDPYGRLFNLPSVWKIFFLTGINQSHTDIVAGILIASFLMGLIVFANELKVFSALLLAVCSFSPPVFLAFERGNVDLFVFLICALSLTWMGKNQLLSLSLIWFAGILKIYPIFGMASFIHLDKNKIRKYFMAFALAFGMYGLLTLDGFQRAFSNTEVGFDLSFGLGVLPTYVEKMTNNYLYILIASLTSILLVMLFMFLAVYLWTHSHNSLIGSDARHLSAFRLGAGIYIGTFLLGNNWDYRLIFLLFTLPQLVDWGKQSKLAIYTLVAIVISFFYLWLAMISPSAYFLDEVANWIIFAGLFNLMIVSLPGWMKTELHLFLERYNKKKSK